MAAKKKQSTTVAAVPKKRVIILDYMKTIALFFMVMIHVIEEMSFFDTVAEQPAGFFRNFIEFGAGPLVAPVYMFSMGACLVLARKNDPVQLAKRGLSMWVLAMALNIVRDVVPNFIAAAIAGTTPDPDYIYFLVFNIDILHFASMALLLTSLLKTLKTPAWGYLPIAILMQIAGGMLSAFVPENRIAECILSYFYPAGELAFFPLLTWYIWVAAGISGGEVYIHDREVEHHYGKILAMCAIFLTGYLYGLNYCGYDSRSFYTLYEDLYYDQTFLHFIFNALVILMEVAMIHLIFSKTEFGYSFCKFCGINLNTIYLVQWILVGWSCTAKEYWGIAFSFEMCAAIGIVYAFLAIGITRMLPQVNLANLKPEAKHHSSVDTRW